ncbi:hypothetical protein BSKO_04230 [Bryopsis sp. KO-2023]|nr:hypothetical protein BSKO_04230 [Bryopsis sp. KO-2023]
MVGSTMLPSSHACQLLAGRSRALAWRSRGRVGGGNNIPFAAAPRVLTSEEPVTEVANPSTKELNVADGNVVNFADTINVGAADAELEGTDLVARRALEEQVRNVEAKDEGMLSNAWEKFNGLFNWSGRVRGLVLLNVMTVIMATNWVVVKDAETMLDPFTFSALRFTVATLAILPFLKGQTEKAEPEVVKAGVELGVWFALGYLTQSLGLLTTDASRASFFSAFTVILVPIITGVTGKGVSKNTWMAAGVALFGTTLLEQGGNAPPGIGDVFNILSAMFFAIQIIRTEKYSKEMPNSSMQLLGTSLITTCVVSSLLAVGTHPSETLSLIQNFSPAVVSGVPWNEVFYTGVMSTDIVLLIELVALHDVASTDAAIVYTMEPVLGAVLAYIVLGDRWGPAGWVGAALILASSLGTQLLGEDNGEMEKTAEESR